MSVSHTSTARSPGAIASTVRFVNFCFIEAPLFLTHVRTARRNEENCLISGPSDGGGRRTAAPLYFYLFLARWVQRTRAIQPSSDPSSNNGSTTGQERSAA